MFSRFFVRRPVFAWVIAILIMLAGVLAIQTLPVAQYPDVAPPAVKISATYTGASAETLENSVTQVIEQQLTGLDNLLYFTSTSSSDGSVDITVTFEQGPTRIPPRCRCRTRSSRRNRVCRARCNSPASR
ncbi:Multidrug-efflux transporter MexB [Raoultella ornithinolytica]|nr:Multidrug-efflux transporter MexB [Raoultella ornithinolytica]